jgi:hypothetical protein
MKWVGIFLSSYCNSPGVMTVVNGNHSDDLFVTQLCDKNRAIMLHFSFTFFFILKSFTFLEHIFGSVLVYLHSLLCSG